MTHTAVTDLHTECVNLFVSECEKERQRESVHVCVFTETKNKVVSHVSKYAHHC